MSEYKKSIYWQTFRGFGYSLISLLTLLSGYMIQSGATMSGADWSMAPILELFLFYCISIPFFTVYSATYTYEDTGPIPTGFAYFIGLVITSLIAIILYLVNFILFNENFVINLIPILVYALIFNGYALIFILQGNNPNILKQIRHQLVWPVMITVGLNLFYGLNFDEIYTTWTSLWPVGLLVILIIVPEILKLEKKGFNLWVIGALFTVSSFCAIYAIYFREPVNSLYVSMMVCVVVSAYLAAFESWRITAYFLKTGGTEVGSLGTNYYVAARGGLTLSLLIMPFVVLFIDVGIFFLVGFTLHSLVAYFFWSTLYYEKDKLVKSEWIAWKLLFGFAFLAILIFDSLNPITPEVRVSNNVLLTIFGALMALYIPAVLSSDGLKQAKTRCKTRGEALFVYVFGEHKFTRSFAPISIVFLITLFVLNHKELKDNFGYRANHTTIIYLVYILIGIIHEIIDDDNIGDVLKRIKDVFLGLFQTTRIFVGLFIGIIIIIPLILKSFPLTSALTIALPIALAALGGFAINDYTDYKRDIINKPYRAIPSGKISRRTALTVGVGLIGLAGLTALSGSEFGDNLIIVYVFTIIGVVVYNYLVRVSAISKTIFTAALCTMPILVIIDTLRYDQVYFLLPVSALLFITGRELLLDITDIVGDRKYQIKTLVFLIGDEQVKHLAFILQGLSLLLLVLFSIIMKSILMIAISTGLIVMSYTFANKWNQANNKSRIKFVKLMWIQMLMVIVYLVI